MLVEIIPLKIEAKIDKKLPRRKSDLGVLLIKKPIFGRPMPE